MTPIVLIRLKANQLGQHIETVEVVQKNSRKVGEKTPKNNLSK
jgi:hypothetical protein